jgi:hypothetical protein
MTTDQATESQKKIVLLRDVMERYLSAATTPPRGYRNYLHISKRQTALLRLVRCEDFAAGEWREFMALRLRSVKPSTLRRQLVLLRSAWEAIHSMPT